MIDHRVRDTVLGLDIGPSGYGRAVCPVCPENHGSEDRKGSLWFHGETGFFGCWRCGIKGKVETEEDSWKPLPLTPPEAAPPPKLPEEAISLGTIEARTSRAFAPAFEYLLEKRGFSWEVIEAAKPYACLEGFYAKRILFPCYHGGKPCGFVARSWVKCDRPYLYPKGFDRSVMWNGGAVDSTTTDPLIIVEGIFDALRHWPNAVALLGKPSGRQIDILADSQRPLIIALDGDAWQEGRALALKLKLRGTKASWVRLPLGEDPDSLGSAGLTSLRVE